MEGTARPGLELQVPAATGEAVGSISTVNDPPTTTTDPTTPTMTAAPANPPITPSITLSVPPAENGEEDMAPKEPVPITTPTTSLSSLPLHLVAQTLGHLDAVNELPSVLLSHRIFYAASRDIPSLTRDLLRAEIGDDRSLVLAFLTHASNSRRRCRHMLSVQDFLLAWRDNPRRLIGRYRLVGVAEATRIGALHNIVVDLRREYVRHAARSLYAPAPVAGEAGASASTSASASVAAELSAKRLKLSQTETRRIDRAIYRFQIYCNLFGEPFRFGDERPSDVDLKRLFFDRHSPWVNEQLGCFYDFLEGKLDEVIERAVALNPERAAWLHDRTRATRKQQYLSLGLAWIHQLLTVGDLTKQYDLLYTSNYTTLLSAVPTPATPNFDGMPTEEEDTGWNLDLDDLAREHAADEEGPRQMWTDTHSGSSNDVFFVVDQDRELRRLGYVIWDRDRIEADSVCIENIKEAQRDGRPTFATPTRFINVARSWDKQFNPRNNLVPQQQDPQQPRLSARERRAARLRNAATNA